jgi:PAS domain S-box-containing protein
LSNVVRRSHLLEVFTISTGSIHVAKNSNVRPEAAPATRTIPVSLYSEYLLKFAIVFVTYFVAGKLGQATTNIRSSNLGPVWPAYGVALGAFLLYGYRIWPAVASAAFVIAFLSPVPFWTALGQAAGTTVAALTGLFLLRVIASFDISIARLRDALAFVFLGGLGSAIVSASIGTLVLRASHVRAYSGLGSAWLIYWLGDSTGALLVTPLMLTITDLVRIRGWRRIAEFVCLLMILVACCTAVFGDLPLIPVRMIAFVILPVIIWAAVRFGVSAVAFSIFIVATIATVETALGSGSFTAGTPFVNGIQLDAFFTILPLTGLSFAALSAERERAERQRAESIREQVAMELALQNKQILEASEERLRLAQQAARIGTFERDMRSGIVTSSTELELMYGLSPGEFESTPTAFFESLIHPDDRERVMSLSNQAMKTGHPMSAEWRVVWPDGSVHWISGSWQVFMDASGEPARMIGVNKDISERKRAEEALSALNNTLEAQTALLQSSEELLKIFVKNVPAGVVMLDRDMRYLQVSDRWCSDYSVDSSKVIGRSHYEVFPEISERWKEVHRRALQGETLRAEEDRWDRPGGAMWIRWEVRPWKTADGSIGGILILAEDITHRKQMQIALSNMTRKLIDAQEKERARIGRELHDDINQRIALLSVELGDLQEDPAELKKRLEEFQTRMKEISNDVQALSHDLHSSKLEYLGVVRGIRSWCREFAERNRMTIDFTADVSSTVPVELGLTLLRVTQEALFNSIKYSGVTRVEVRLLERPSEIHLIVSDSGKGFDTKEAEKGKGLGLTSMRERVRLLNGRISIQSKQMQGTRIEVYLPFESAA